MSMKLLKMNEVIADEGMYCLKCGSEPEHHEICNSFIVVPCCKV